jgi:hypothetical protein
MFGARIKIIKILSISSVETAVPKEKTSAGKS